MRLPLPPARPALKYYRDEYRFRQGKKEYIYFFLDFSEKEDLREIFKIVYIFRNKVLTDLS